MQEQKITINGLEVNYKIIRQGLPILVLHGWGIGSEAWVGIADILAENGYKIILPDMPGFGKSDSADIAWNFDDYINWLEKFVKVLKLEKFILVGHSFGGALANKFCALHPEIVEKLILCAAAVIRRERLGGRQKIAKFLAGIKNEKLTKYIPNGIYVSLRKIIYKIGGSKDYAMTQGIMTQIFKNVAKYDTLEYASQIKIPTLIVWGEKDNKTPLSDAREINKAINNSQLAIIRGAGHRLHRTHTAELAEIIIKFLK